MYKKAYVEITNICNMSCSFCHGHKRAAKLMSKEEFSLVLDKLQGKTKYIYYHLMGEPLTHPLLGEFLKMAGGRGYKSIITTNGTLLKKRSAELLTRDLHKINISLHSFENGDNSHQEAYVSQIAEFAKAAAMQGTIVVFRLWNKGLDGGKNQVTLNVLHEHFGNDWQENSRGIKICERIFLEWGERFEWPDSSSAIKGERFFCYGLKDQFGILSNGTVVPCCLDSDGVIELGNIFTEDLEKILKSERATAMVNGFKCGKATEELCKRCGYAQRFV